MLGHSTYRKVTLGGLRDPAGQNLFFPRGASAGLAQPGAPEAALG